MSSDRDKIGEETALAQKIDALSASVDRRFDLVDEHLGTLSASVDDRFTTLAASLDERFDAVTVALAEQRQYTEFAFGAVESRFDTVDRRFDTVDRRFDRLERKLDQFIDTQSAANTLVERRLTALEPRSAHE